jgi:hypothetical protein
MAKLQVVVAAFALGVVSLGCQSANSENVKTPGIAASFRVTDALSGGVAAHVELKIGSTYIDLSGGDALFCDGVKLGKSEGLLNEVLYDATVSRRTPGDSYVFEFRRPDPPEDHLSYAFSPEPVVISVPSNGAVISSKSATSVAWATAAQGSIGISVTGSGVHNKYYGVGADRGTFTIPQNDLICEENLTSCSVLLTITRTVVGTGDPDFESAQVESVTNASIDLQLKM